MDLVKLTRAVAHAETNNGKSGYGKTVNNLCGIMHWPNGQRTIREYDSYQAGFDSCYSLLKRKYQDYTIEGMAVKWTGNHNPDTWAKNVEYWYNK